jgi:hypothetical protein
MIMMMMVMIIMKKKKKFVAMAMIIEPDKFINSSFKH